MARKEFLVFEFFGAKGYTFCRQSADSADTIASGLMWGEPTEIIVKHKAFYRRTRQITHSKAHCEGHFYSIVDLDRYTDLCQKADAEWVEQRNKIRFESDLVASKNRLFSEAEIPNDLKRLVCIEISGCWIWTGRLSSQGYGQIRQKGKNIAAHRLVFERMVSPIPRGAVLRHSCDVRNCVNPAHLLPGTEKQNFDDMWSRGRSSLQREMRRKAEIAEASQWRAQRFPRSQDCEFQALSKRLRSNIELNGARCWIWNGQRFPFGRPKHSWRGKHVEVGTHIVSRVLGKVPDRITFKRRCGNQLCVNPAHFIAQVSLGKR